MLTSTLSLTLDDAPLLHVRQVGDPLLQAVKDVCGVQDGGPARLALLWVVVRAAGSAQKMDMLGCYQAPVLQRPLPPAVHLV